MAERTADGIRRFTLLRSEGHQIRLTTVRVAGFRVRIVVGCRCTRERLLATDGQQDHWALCNQLQHDPAAGDFTPVDETTGAVLR